MLERDVPEAAIAASQVATVVKLYDSTLRHIADASQAAERADFDAQLNAVLSANEILAGLDSVLDLSRGGSVAANLHDMYRTVSLALTNSIGNTNAIEIYCKLTEGLRQTRNAWAEIAGVPQTR